METRKYAITLIDAGPNKNKVIIAISQLLYLSLKEASDSVNHTPHTFEENFTYDYAKDVEIELIQAGATVKVEEVEIENSTNNNVTYDTPINNVAEATPNYTNTLFSSVVMQPNINANRKKMTTQELMDYFKDVFALESQIYTYERVEKAYAEKLSYIGVPRPLKLSFYDTVSKKIVPASERTANEIPVISGEFLEETRKPEWKDGKGYGMAVANYSKARGSNIKAMLILHIIFALIIALLRIFEISGIVGSCIVLFIPYIFCLFKVMDYCSAGAPVSVQRQLLSYYNKCAQEESLKIAESEQPLRKHIEIERVELVNKPKAEIRKLLDKVYAENIIFPKYRNFTAVAQIYEYLVSGRCSELEGPNGAYNLYESELRQNIIINKLDEIITQLERLNYTMGTVCAAIQETNYLLSNISSTLNRIEANTALTAYNAQCIAHNARIANTYVV